MHPLFCLQKHVQSVSTLPPLINLNFVCPKFITIAKQSQKTFHSVQLHLASYSCAIYQELLLFCCLSLSIYDACRWDSNLERPGERSFCKTYEHGTVANQGLRKCVLSFIRVCVRHETPPKVPFPCTICHPLSPIPLTPDIQMLLKGFLVFFL